MTLRDVGYTRVYLPAIDDSVAAPASRRQQQNPLKTAASECFFFE